MSLAILATIAANVMPAANIDLASPTIYVSKEAREAIASGTVGSLACFQLPKRSRKYRTACLTSTEWARAAELTTLQARRAKGAHEPYDTRPGPVPAQSSPYQSTWGPQ